VQGLGISDKLITATYHPESNLIYSISYSFGVLSESKVEQIEESFNAVAQKGRGGKGSIFVVANGNRNSFPSGASSNYNRYAAF
jgi:hypothetical protein